MSGECKVKEAPTLHSKQCVVGHFTVSSAVFTTVDYNNPVWVNCELLFLLLAHIVPKYAVLKSQTQRLGLKYSPNWLCFIMPCLNIAQQLCELIYLWQPRRGQHFFHTFEKSLDGRK